MSRSGRRCVFFDRDGIVNASPGAGYVERWEDFRLLPEFVDALRRVTAAGWVAVVVTNQRGVARGLVPAEEVERIHRNLRERLRAEYGLELLDILYCPHDEGQCECRKPKPGLLLEAARRHGIELSASWMVGDHETDVEAGRRAGCRTVRVGAGDEPSQADVCVADMSELARAIEGLLAR